VQALGAILGYAKQGFISLDDMARPLNLAAAALESVAQGPAAEFSWKTLLQGDARSLDLHRFVEVWPVLDHAALEPGGRATAAIREVATPDVSTEGYFDLRLTRGKPHWISPWGEAAAFRFLRVAISPSTPRPPESGSKS
jgi:hypothetical protein